MCVHTAIDSVFFPAGASFSLSLSLHRDTQKWRRGETVILDRDRAVFDETMARRIDLSHPQPFDVRTARVGTTWPKWRRGFEYFLSASGITMDGQKRALLLHCAGPDVQELYETLEDKDCT